MSNTISWLAPLGIMVSLMTFNGWFQEKMNSFPRNMQRPHGNPAALGWNYGQVTFHSNIHHMLMHERDVEHARKLHLDQLKIEKFGSLAAARRAYNIHAHNELMARGEEVEEMLAKRHH